MELEALLEKLEEHGPVKPSGMDYIACCPAHDDRTPSLSVKEDDGKILVTCHAGCKTEDVLAAMDLKMSDLFVRQREKRAQRVPVEAYDYEDELGNVLFQTVRYENPKTFRQRHWEDGQWLWNLDGVRRVLYRLPEVHEAALTGQTIYVCEGEKDVEALRAEGRVATCNPMGAGKWRPEYADLLEGVNEIIIVADRDEPGRAHANAIKDSLIGRVGRIWVVQAKSGKDAADHINAGHPLREFELIRERVRRGVVTAREMAAQAMEDLQLGEADIPGYVFTPEVPLIFRQGRMYALGAYTGDGKTCYALQGFRSLAAAGKRVGYFSLEMPERDLRNRLVAHRGVPLALTEEPWRLRQSPEALSLYEQAIGEIANWNADIIFDSSMTAEKITELSGEREYEAVIIDHVHRFGWGRERRSLEEQVTTLTNLALEQNIMLLILCQLRRFTRGKDFDVYPKPTLQDFRETEMIGQDASMALAVWRQRDNSGVKYTGHTEVIVLKNRHTTGAGDAAGRMFMPYFDIDQQMFVPRREVPVAVV